VKTGLIVARHDRYLNSKTAIPFSYLVFTKISVVPTRYSIRRVPVHGWPTVVPDVPTIAASGVDILSPLDTNSEQVLGGGLLEVPVCGNCSTSRHPPDLSLAMQAD